MNCDIGKVIEKKYFIAFLFMILCCIKSNADSTLLRKTYVLKKTNNIGLNYYGWQSIAFGGGKGLDYASWGFGKLITYERFVIDRFSISIGISQLNSHQKEGKFKMNLLTIPLYFKYYPKMLKNYVNFNLAFVNGYQRITFNNDSSNFHNFQTNINVGIGLLLCPKHVFKKPNNHWIFEIQSGIPILNFTKFWELPSGYVGIKYNLSKH